MKAGDVVGLNEKAKRFGCPKGRENNRTAKILAMLTDVEGGVFTDRDLGGCRYWNVEDLVVVAA